MKSNEFDPNDFPRWEAQLRNVITLNKWDSTKTLLVLKVLLDDTLQELIQYEKDFENALSILKKEFFTPSDFFEYEKQLRNIRSSNFKTIKGLQNL